MKVIKKTNPARVSGSPSLVYIVATVDLLRSRKIQGMITAIAKDIPKVWVCVLDSTGNASSFANSLNLNHAGVILSSQGDLTRRLYKWSSPEKPFLVTPVSMAKELDERASRYTGLISADTADQLYDRLLAVGVKAQNFVDSNQKLSQMAPMAKSSLTLYDIQRPSATQMKNFLKKWSATSLNRAAFLQLLEDTAELYSIPAEVLIQLGKYEYYGLKRDDYYSSFRGGYNNSYSGPFQVGYTHYLDTRNYFKRAYGVTVPSNRDKASLGVQVASSVDAIRRGANASSTLRVQPLDAIGFYLIHNQGAGGAINIINNRITSKVKKNLRAQSAEVRSAIESRYGITI